MRVDRPSVQFIRFLGATVFATAVVFGGFAAGSLGAVVGGLAGLTIGVLIDRIHARRWSRRKRILSSAFPPSWRRTLEDRYDHYHRLAPDLKRRFENDLRLFLAETRITGIGVAVTEELQLLVAASAMTLSVAWPDYEWDQLTEVLLYPQDFDRDYSFQDKDRSGEAHGWGTVILSVPALEESFDDPDDGYHVGIHEFAHLLDVHQTHFDGIPVGLTGNQVEEWIDLVKKEMERLQKGKSVLDPYGAEEPAEFLAVAVEAFFEMPLLLRKRHRELYAMLSGYFRQDPAAWDDERGFVA